MGTRAWVPAFAGMTEVVAGIPGRPHPLAEAGGPHTAGLPDDKSLIDGVVREVPLLESDSSSDDWDAH